MSRLSNADIPVVLTVSGSDSGGGTGIQGDLKTFASHNVFGATAITCITAQNPSKINRIEPLSPDLVTAQIAAVSEAFPISAAKTGLLYTAGIINAVAQADIAQGIPILVVDPVMVTSAGKRVLKPDAVDALLTGLLPAARVVTPNLHEAEIICGHPIGDPSDLAKAAQKISEKYDVACIANGGRIPGETVVDILYDEGQLEIHEAPRVPASETHGCGCAFSAALAANLANGQLMKDAFINAINYVRLALESAPQVGPHSPLYYRAESSASMV